MHLIRRFLAIILVGMAVWIVRPGSVVAASGASPSPAAPVAPILRVCQPYWYSVVFPAGSATLTTEMLAVIRTAFLDIRERDRQLEIETFFDPSESTAHGEEIARQRDVAVREALVGLGLPGEKLMDTRLIPIEGDYERVAPSLRGRVDLMSNTFKLGFCGS